MVNAYAVHGGAEGTTSSSSGSGTTTPSYVSAAGITSGRLYRGGGRALGTAASNRSPSTNASPNATASATAGSRGGSGATGASGRVPLPPGIGGGLGLAAAATGDEAGFPLLRRGGGEGGAGGGDSREIDL